MSTQILDAPQTLTFDFDDFAEDAVVVIGNLPGAPLLAQWDETGPGVISYISCYSSTCTWAECCDKATQDEEEIPCSG